MKKSTDPKKTGQSVSHPTASDELVKLQEALELVRAEVVKAQEGERRALADYQNLQRRVQEERVRLLKTAGQETLMPLLSPLDHLHMAKEQLKDRGLDMVCQQFQQALHSLGVQEIDAVSQPLDELKMEVIDTRPVNDPLQHGIVLAVTQRGYLLHGEVLRHAKVVVGVRSDQNKEQVKQ